MVETHFIYESLVLVFNKKKPGCHNLLKSTSLNACNIYKYIRY